MAYEYPVRWKITSAFEPVREHTDPKGLARTCLLHPCCESRVNLGTSRVLSSSSNVQCRACDHGILERDCLAVVVRIRAEADADIRACRPYFSALLVATYSKGGHIAKGIQALTEALGITHKTGECMHQAELYRLKGELVLQSQVRSPEEFKVQSPRSNSVQSPRSKV